MLKPDAYDTIGYTTYSCALCVKAVGCEENIRYDKQGNVMVYYTPASRYWSLDGVFCSVDCSFNHHLNQIRPKDAFYS